MARLQILELPEGSGDDRPPFVLVVDRMPKDEAAFDVLRRDLSDDLAQRLGARAVLVFEEAVDIPANDVSAYSGSAMQEVKLQLEGHDIEAAGERAIRHPQTGAR